MKAARYAIELALPCGSEMIAICVVQIPEYIEEHVRSILRDDLFGKSNKTLAEIEVLANSSKVKYRSETLETSGAIATTICNFADKMEADLVILGTRKNTSSLTKMMLGSVAAGVVGNASCPVLVVR